MWLDLKVSKKIVEALDICSFELVNPHGEQLPAFDAGAHIDVMCPDGHVRQYSLCNIPTERSRYLICVLKDAQSRGGSRAMHELVQAGDNIRVSAPRNHFAIDVTAEMSILLAGGIGVTPIICMAEQLAASGSAFQMHYCARSRERAAFYQRITSSEFSDRVYFHFDDVAASQRLDVGALLAEIDVNTHVYVCGPAGFLNFVIESAKHAGLNEERIHFEYFSAAPVAHEADRRFQVKLARTGVTLMVDAGVTVVEALAAEGIDVPVSCEQGVCGTCITGVLEGIPDHRDSYFSKVEKAKNDQFTPCCSRSRTPLLVLDL